MSGPAGSIPILEARSLGVERGGVRVLDLPSLSLAPGRFLTLVGPNGAGKSTLLLALACLIRPSTGSLLFHGRPLDSGAARFAYRRRISMVFQEPLLFDTTVEGNIASGLRLRGAGKEETRRIVAEGAARFGISHLLKRAARTLSGGEARRTSLARAFALQPEILILDEPFSALDPPTRDGLIEDLSGALRDTPVTAVMATHEPAEALRLSDEIAVMNAGRIVQIGPPETVMNQPADELVASFVGVESVIAGTVASDDGGLLSVTTHRRGARGTELRILAVGEAGVGAPVILCIRPENVALSTHPAEASSVRNVFPGRVVRLTPRGPYTRVEIDCGFPLVAHITRPALEDLTLTVGQEVTAAFKATGVHVIRR
jgi:tungstate transport system ATP-binding protein